MNKQTLCGTWTQSRSKVWSNASNKEKMKSSVSTHAKQLKTSQPSPSALDATSPLLKSPLCCWTSTTQSSSRASRPQLLSLSLTFASSTPRYFQPSLNRLLANSSPKHFLKGRRESNKLSWQWLTSLWHNLTRSLTRRCKKTILSKQQFVSFWRTSQLCSEARQYWHTCCYSKWTPNGWSSQSSRISTKISTNSLEITTSTYSAVCCAWSRPSALSWSLLSWPPLKKVLINSKTTLWKQTPTSLKDSRRCYREVKKSFRIWKEVLCWFLQSMRWWPHLALSLRFASKTWFRSLLTCLTIQNSIPIALVSTSSECASSKSWNKWLKTINSWSLIKRKSWTICFQPSSRKSKAKAQTSGFKA